jgi:hypothetical protein
MGRDRGGYNGRRRFRAHSLDSVAGCPFFAHSLREEWEVWIIANRGCCPKLRFSLPGTPSERRLNEVVGPCSLHRRSLRRLRAPHRLPTRLRPTHAPEPLVPKPLLVDWIQLAVRTRITSRMRKEQLRGCLFDRSVQLFAVRKAQISATDNSSSSPPACRRGDVRLRFSREELPPMFFFWAGADRSRATAASRIRVTLRRLPRSSLTIGLYRE